MGIRFFIPLPGPFYYAPGKKNPKPKGESTTAATGNIASRIIINNGQRVYNNAHDYATSNGIDDADHFAASTLNQATTNWKIAHGIGFAAALAFWFWQMGFGALIVALVPGLNIVAIGIPAVLIGMAISAYLHRGDTLHREIAARIEAGETIDA